MQVTVNVSRSDIAWLNLSRLFRLKANLQLFLFVLTVSAFFAWRAAVDDGGHLNWMVVSIASLVGAAIGFSAIFVFSLAFVLIHSTVKSGVLGNHTYTIEDAGLREVSEANDTLAFWPSILNVEKSRRYILIQMTPWAFHVLPHREFENEQQYDSFFSLVERHYKEHSTNG